MAGIERLGGDPPSPWEGRYGYSRVIRAGGFVMIGGMTSVSEDGVVMGESAYEQTVEILAKLEHELSRLGAGLADVVSNRCYVTDISRCDEIGRAHGERFASVRPLMTMVEVSALIDPRMLVEIETTAFIG